MNLSSYFITIAIFSLPIKPSIVYSSWNNIIYNETERLVIAQTFDLRDKTILHMTRPINETCIEPQIDLRILHRNDTIEVAWVDYSIPEHNFCNEIFQIKHYHLNYLLVLYVNSTDIESASYYALLVDYEGKFIRFVSFYCTSEFNAFYTS